jgi:hypothetical protein
MVNAGINRSMTVSINRTVSLDWNYFFTEMLRIILNCMVNAGINRSTTVSIDQSTTVSIDQSTTVSIDRTVSLDWI